MNKGTPSFLWGISQLNWVKSPPKINRRDWGRFMPIIGTSLSWNRVGIVNEWYMVGSSVVEFSLSKKQETRSKFQGAHCAVTAGTYVIRNDAFGLNIVHNTLFNLVILHLVLILPSFPFCGQVLFRLSTVCSFISPRLLCQTKSKSENDYTFNF